MILLKRFFFSLTIIFLILTNILKADDSDDLIDELTSQTEMGEIKKSDTPAIRTNIDVLADILALGVNTVLAKDFYLKTHTVLKRPINSLPIFNLYHTDHICQDWLIKIHLFGDVTDKAFFTDSCPFINSFLNLNDPDIIKTVNEIAPQAEPFFDLLSKTKKQERRSGLMFQILKDFDDISFEATLPFIFEERNYFLTPQEIADIEDQIGGTEQHEDRVLLKHVVSDKLGVGDLRFKAGYSILTMENICIKAGIQTTIPVAFAIKKGLIGSDFRGFTKRARPSFSFKEITDLDFGVDKDQKKLTQILQNFGICVADWLSAITLDSPLGNSGHFGVGIFFEPKVKINDCVILRAITYFEYFFPSNERRYFLKIKNPADFATDKLKKDLENETAATRDVAFLDQQVIETLFPPAFKTQVSPGVMFQISVGPQFKLREWDLAFGYDFWFVSKEKIDFIHCNPGNLNIQKALKPSPFASKIFVNLSYNKIKKDHDIRFGLNFEDTLATRNIGKDIAASLSFEINY